MLPRNHPALGAFRRKKRTNWEFIADELAVELRRHTGHQEGCDCTTCLALVIYDKAKWRYPAMS